MKNNVKAFISRVRSEARRKSSSVTVTTTGRSRTFVAYDWGCDTFIFEKDIWHDVEDHHPMLLVRKRDLVKGSSGYVMTMTKGNHAVAAMPLLSGQFWNLGRIAASQRSSILASKVVCSNVADGKIEISQREVPTDLIVQSDEWLQAVGFMLEDIVMIERNDLTLEYYRRLGQEWRVKPLAWTRKEMEFAIQASRKRLNSPLRYYHSSKGVHFLSYSEFHKIAEWATSDYAQALLCLRELVSVAEGGKKSYVRTAKFHGHYEVEFFGLQRGEAFQRLIPSIERMLEWITLGMIEQQDVVTSILALDELFRSLLERPELENEASEDFIETLYMHLTGAIYAAHSDFSIAPAFDDRRTALPGATYCGGLPQFHPGADERTQILLRNIEKTMSQDESVEYANIYELRTHEDVLLGSGVTREIVFKTNRRPLYTSLIEKRLKLKKPGYGSYMLARVYAFKELGVNFGVYKLLRWMENTTGAEVTSFIRTRYPGDSLEDIPARLFVKLDDMGHGMSGENPDVVLALGALLGSAAAQNMVLKKYLPDLKSCRFGEGKEIFEFAYDIKQRREMPVHVSICSIRGAMGWPNLSHDQQNLDAIAVFYLTRYAEVLVKYWKKHSEAVAMDVLSSRFFDGFALKTREIHRNYEVRREQFAAFDPGVRAQYHFAEQWRFALWTLHLQSKHLDVLRDKFMAILQQVLAKEQV
ncbi:MAG: hypothetical protein WCP12_07200 [bacterium]